MIGLHRAYLPFGAGTLGMLNVQGRHFATLELPWRGNKTYVSCIPEGVYTLRKRQSGVVTRSTGGEYSIGWEVADVTGRSHIMIHPANWTHELEGCIAPGVAHGWDEDGPRVYSSRDAFRELMGILDSRDEWQIDIRCNCQEYP